MLTQNKPITALPQIIKIAKSSMECSLVLLFLEKEVKKERFQTKVAIKMNQFLLQISRKNQIRQAASKILIKGFI